MAIPTAYTEPTFAAFLERDLGETASALGWSADRGSFDEAINDALGLAGLNAIEDATDIRTLRVAGRLAVWRAVIRAAAGAVDSDLDGQKLSRSQILKGAKEALALAEAEAAGVGLVADASEAAVMVRASLDFVEPAVW